MEMIENWKNDEQAEQNNIKVPVDFTLQNEGAQGLQEMLHWFTKEKHHSIEDLKNLSLNCFFLTYWIWTGLKAVRRLIVPSLRIVKATRHDSVRELLPLV
ncbi:hypothetical protein pdam_00008215 [Pocillopora damicornis]|uniref:Uncharacterized protein n=1 Tax=Pocillopora damicornis TaxID=46731 RepID=A0A3M6UTU0_POCDA|nr:hypothetical protein pdam_00008215 [Pocillopora damicornis]